MHVGSHASVACCTGRSIRHARDYATIVLLDLRYARSKISAKVPGWIGKRLVHASNYGHAFREVRQFFSAKAEEQRALFDQRRQRATATSSSSTMRR